MTDTITVGVGHSTKAILADAVAEAWSAAASTLSGPASVVLAHVGVGFKQRQALELIRAAAGGAPVVGGSSQGVSVAGLAFERPRFVALAALSGVRCRVASVPDISGASAEAGRNLAEQLGAIPDQPYTTLLYYDPLGGGDAQALVHGMAEGGYRVVYGAASGQPWGVFVKTYQYAGDRVIERGATALVLEGLNPVAELTHGAESVGLEMLVTRAQGNVLYELDGRPALDVWCEQLGVEAVGHVDHTANWALGIRAPEGVSYEGLITRAPFSLDTEARTLIFQAPIPEGSTVRICIRSQSAVYDGAMAMAERLRIAIDGKRPVLALGFECGARPEPFLGSKLATQEVCAIQEVIGAAIPWFGMYAWGEIAPIGDVTHLHNFSFPLCILTI